MSDSKPQIQEDQRAPRRENAKREKERERRQEGGREEGRRKRKRPLGAGWGAQTARAYLHTDLRSVQESVHLKEKKRKKEKRQTLHICACSVASVMSDSWRPYGPQSTRLLCPWDSPGKNTGVGCQVLLQGILLQGIFPTQGSNLCLFVSPALLSRFFTTSATWEALPTSRRIVFELQKTQC